MELKLQSRNERKNQNIFQKLIYKIHKISVKKLLYLSLIFFISMADMPFSLTNPGCAIFACEYIATPSAFVALLVLLAEFICDTSPLNLIQSALSMLIFASFASSKPKICASAYKKSTLMAACAFFCNIVPKLFTTLYLYDTLILILDAAVIFSLGILFHKAKTFFASPKENLNKLLPFTVFVSVAIMGISTFSVNSFNLGVFVCMLFTLVSVYENGYTCAPLGIIVGIALGAQLDAFPYYVTLFSISAFAAGIFSPFGKGCSALSFVLATSITAFYSPSSLQGFLNITLSSSAATLFMLLPKKVTSPFAIIKSDTQNNFRRYKEYVSASLSESAATIADISVSYEKLCPENVAQSSALVSFFERVTSSVCSECALKNRCWKNEFHRTYSAFFVLIEICNKRGSISCCDIPEELIKKCTNSHNISPTFNTLYDIYKVDKLWEYRVLEMRKTVSNQLKCISSSIMQKTAFCNKNTFFMPYYEKQLQKAFDKENIKTKSVFVTKNKKGNITAEITFENNISVEISEKICSDTLKGLYKCISVSENFARLSLFPPHTISTAVAFKTSSKNAQNGDSVAHSYIADGKYAVLLSDGMGCGHIANHHSKISSDLAFKMLQSGFKVLDVLEIINGSLVLKSTETSFATIDMAVADLVSSTVDFYKMGAAPTFIKNGKSVKTIYAATLPAGSFSKSDIGHITHPLSKGDNIIILSDGIANGENTDELEKIISEFPETGENLANMILSYAASLPDSSRDDMTVSVTCIN